MRRFSSLNYNQELYVIVVTWAWKICTRTCMAQLICYTYIVKKSFYVINCICSNNFWLWYLLSKWLKYLGWLYKPEHSLASAMLPGIQKREMEVYSLLSGKYMPPFLIPKHRTQCHMTFIHLLFPLKWGVKVMYTCILRRVSYSP